MFWKASIKLYILAGLVLIADSLDIYILYPLKGGTVCIIYLGSLLSLIPGFAGICMPLHACENT